MEVGEVVLQVVKEEGFGDITRVRGREGQKGKFTR